MKVSVKGNVLTIITDITKEDHKRFSKHGAFTVTDENYDQVYKFYTAATGSISEFAIQTNSVIGGKLALTIIMPEDQDIQEAIEELTPALMALQSNETIVLEKLSTLRAEFTELQDSIEIEE